MTVIEELRARQRELNAQVTEARRVLDRLSEERRIVEHEIAKLTYDCECVRLNRDIGVHSMADLDAANRRGFGLGFVSECLSALKSCPKCHGYGSLEERRSWEGRQ